MHTAQYCICVFVYISLFVYLYIFTPTSSGICQFWLFETKTLSTVVQGKILFDHHRHNWNTPVGLGFFVFFDPDLFVSSLSWWPICLLAVPSQTQMEGCHDFAPCISSKSAANLFLKYSLLNCISCQQLYNCSVCQKALHCNRLILCMVQFKVITDIFTNTRCVKKCSWKKRHCFALRGPSKVLLHTPCNPILPKSWKGKPEQSNSGNEI